MLFPRKGAPTIIAEINPKKAWNIVNDIVWVTISQLISFRVSFILEAFSSTNYCIKNILLIAIISGTMKLIETGKIIIYIVTRVSLHFFLSSKFST